MRYKLKTRDAINESIILRHPNGAANLSRIQTSEPRAPLCVLKKKTQTDIAAIWDFTPNAEHHFITQPYRMQLYN